MTRKKDVTINVTPRLREEADFWSFVVGQRQWWVNAERRRAYMAQLARGTLETILGVKAEDLELLQDALASELMMEVVLPAEPRDSGARDLPWEYVITAALPTGDTELPATMIRRLEVDKKPAQRGRQNRSVLYLEGLPGDLAGTFTFDTERELLNILDAKGERQSLVNPTLSSLKAEVTRLQPDIIHLAGMDSHQARYYRGQSPAAAIDGMVLADDDGEAVDVSAIELAQALCAGRRKPEIIVFNLHNSAS